MFRGWSKLLLRSHCFNSVSKNLNLHKGPQFTYQLFLQSTPLILTKYYLRRMPSQRGPRCNPEETTRSSIPFILKRSTEHEGDTSAETAATGRPTSLRARMQISRLVRLVCGGPASVSRKGQWGTPTAEEVEVETRLHCVAGRGLVRDWVEVVRALTR